MLSMTRGWLSCRVNALTALRDVLNTCGIFFFVEILRLVLSGPPWGTHLKGALYGPLLAFAATRYDSDNFYLTIVVS